MARKKRNKEMEESELLSLLDFEISNALGRHDGELSDQRRRSMRAYYGESIGNEVAGRSRIVTRDVLEVVEWAMPELLDVFASGDEIAIFSPNSEVDEQEAQQATDYINHIFFNENDGFEILHDMFKDALMQKSGITKVWWDDTPKVSVEEYSGLDEFAFQKLVSQEDVEVLEHTQDFIEDQETLQALGVPDGMPFPVHNLKVERTETSGRVRVEVVPPEEIMFSRLSKNIKDVRMAAHRIEMSISDLKEMFPELSDDELDALGGDDEQRWDQEYLARHDFDNSNVEDPFQGEGVGRTIWITEVYIYVDFDGDGRAELRKITKAENKILDNVEIDEVPFSLITPIRIPHKLIGMSLSDITMDLQVVKSSILRNLLDNIYNLNHGRFEAVDGMVNMDDLLTSRPGGVVRVQQLGALKRLDTPPIPNGGFEMVDYVDKLRDGRTGISKFRTGLDTDFLNNAKAGPVDNQMEAANARLRLYARIFSETGVKDTFEKIYKVCAMHQQHTATIKLRGTWSQIDPSAWGGKCNLKIKTGLGHGDRAKKISEMVMIGQQYSALRQDPELRAMVTRDNVYHAFAEGLKAMDYKNVGQFLSDPKTLQPYKPQPDPKQQAAQAKAQVDMQRLKLDEQKMQMDGQKMQVQLQLEQQKAQIDAQRAQLEMQSLQQKNAIEVASLQAKLQAAEQQNMIEHEKSQIEVMKLQAEMSKLEVQVEMKAAELRLNEQELELEKEQRRAVKIGD